MNRNKAKMLCDEILQIEQPNCNIKAGNFKSENSPQIFLYGAGNLGFQIGEALKLKDIEVAAFLDRNAVKGQMLLGIPVYKPNDDVITEEQKQRAVVLVTIFLPQREIQNIKGFIAQYGFNNIMARYNLIYPWLHFMQDTDEKAIASQKEKIIDALALMQDEESIKIFCSNLQAHANYEYESAIVSENMEQYFDVKVPFSKGFSNFVDCGAFTGDSLEKLLPYHKLTNYYAFEPDKDNYKKLQETAEGFIDKMETAFLFPCGVSGENDFLSFQSGGSSASTIQENGDTTIQVVAMDKILKKAPITMIKMDIEGAEKSAIMGAEQIIKTQKPDMCICVYHKISDMWEFPLLLKELVPEYKFYMRCHQALTMETVLYVTI